MSELHGTTAGRVIRRATRPNTGDAEAPPDTTDPAELLARSVPLLRHLGRLWFTPQTADSPDDLAQDIALRALARLHTYDPTRFRSGFECWLRLQARTVAHIPYVGFAFAALGDHVLRILLLALPAILIALLMLARVWREAGEDVRRSRGAREVHA